VYLVFPIGLLSTSNVCYSRWHCKEHPIKIAPLV